MARSALRSILAATDLGPASDAVVEGAAVLADRLGAELHLLHAFDLDRFSSAAEAGPTSFQERTRQAERVLAEQVGRVASMAHPASMQVVHYAPEKAIKEYAAHVSADLIALGPHRGGDVGAHFLGTTADAVIRESRVPCLVVRAEGLRVPAVRIGVPTDFSGPARGALDLALVLADSLGDGRGPEAPEIRVFHVGWNVERIDNPQLEREEIHPALEREIRNVVERSSTPLRASVHADVLWGVSPVDGIADYARDTGVDLLVLGTSGRSGLKRLLVGSVASGVARQAPCPVLLVPPPPS